MEVQSEDPYRLYTPDNPSLGKGVEEASTDYLIVRNNSGSESSGSGRQTKNANQLCENPPPSKSSPGICPQEPGIVNQSYEQPEFRPFLFKQQAPVFDPWENWKNSDPTLQMDHGYSKLVASTNSEHSKLILVTETDTETDLLHHLRGTACDRPERITEKAFSTMNPQDALLFPQDGFIVPMDDGYQAFSV